MSRKKGQLGFSDLLNRSRQKSSWDKYRAPKVFEVKKAGGVFLLEGLSRKSLEISYGGRAPKNAHETVTCLLNQIDPAKLRLGDKFETPFGTFVYTDVDGWVTLVKE